MHSYSSSLTQDRSCNNSPFYPVIMFCISITLSSKLVQKEITIHLISNFSSWHTATSGYLTDYCSTATILSIQTLSHSKGSMSHLPSINTILSRSYQAFKPIIMVNVRKTGCTTLANSILLCWFCEERCTPSPPHLYWESKRSHLKSFTNVPLVIT